MATYLDRIVSAHRAHAHDDRRDLDDLECQALLTEPTRGFTDALVGAPGIALIAEVKRASPSKGLLAAELEPAKLALEYQEGGASALSVLTDAEFFLGSEGDLDQARSAVSLPVLRKDFTVCPADVYDARIMGADALLLIVAALSDAEVREFLEIAASIGMDALVEVHDEAEAERALAAGAQLIGVNQRDLSTFAVDTARAERVARAVGASQTLVAESGIRDSDDVVRLADAGFSAVLVGESLVTAADSRRGRSAALRSERAVQAGAGLMFVKICGVTSEDDALLAVALGADAVGFVLAPSPRQVAAQIVGDIVKRLPPEIITVGVFRDAAREQVLDTAQQAGLTAVQLHGHETPETAKWLRARLPMVFQAFPAGAPEVARADDWGVDAILIDAPNAGSGRVFDWSLAADVPSSQRVIVAGGLDPSNVAAAIATIRPWGVDVASGVEEAPGQKDAIKLRDFIREARSAFALLDDDATFLRDSDLGGDELPYDWEEEA